MHLVEDDVVVLDGGGGVTLLLPAAPCSDISVKIGGETVNDYTVSAERGVLRRARGWPEDLGNIEVTFTHGYDPIPGAVQDAVLEQAALQSLVPVGVLTESAGTQSITYGVQSTTGVTQRWAEAVRRYSIGWGGDRDRL